MSLKDIEKLKERVDKDPNSKLFVPLAEEYKKEGMLEEAISVLLNGIERQPGYMSARVSLGKIYLEKGMMKEARSEFESVIKSIPDNLYAHKKLAEIYRDLGEKSLAAKSYRAVLSLNASDDDAISNLRVLERGDEEEELAWVGTADEETGPTGTQLSPKFQEDIVGAVQEEGSTEGEITPEQHIDEDLNAFKDSLFSDKSPEAMDASEAGSEATEEEAIEIGEEEVSEEEVSFADISEEVMAERPHPAAIPEEKDQAETSAGYAGEEIVEDIFPEPAVSGVSLEAADSFIAGGNYLEAMNIYRKMLSATPENKTVLQRAEELKTLLKLMGKDKEALIAGLDAFLAGIHKRRDEFYGSS